MPERKFHYFTVDKKQVKVFSDEILYIESLKDYVKIHIGDKHIVTKFQIGEVDTLLKNESFLRTHKSFIINTDKITALSAVFVELGNIKIPIGRTFKDQLALFFGKSRKP